MSHTYDYIILDLSHTYDYYLFYYCFIFSLRYYSYNGLMRVLK